MVAGAEQSGKRAPKLLCILGVGRTGSNHLATLLSAIPEIDSRFEIFNPSRSYHMTADELIELSRLSGVAFDPSPENPEAVAVIRSRPDLVLACLRRFLAPEKRLLVFKVFFRHLTVQQVTESIVSQPDIHILFVRRRPIDTFISARKAQQVRTWQGIDTTDIKVAIDVDNFLRWWTARAAWYRDLERACWVRGKAFDHLSYETDIDLPPVEATRSFGARLARAGVTGLTLPDAVVGTNRQDRTRDVAQKVENWPEFERELRARGKLNAAFETFPGYTPTLLQRLCHRFAF